MHIDFFLFDHVHLLGDSAMRPIAPCSARHAALLRLVGSKPTALSRLAWHTDHGALWRIQLRFLG